MRRLSPPPLTFLLCAVLAVLGWRGFDRDGQATPSFEPVASSSATEPTLEDEAETERQAQKSEEYYAAILARPLFTETRRPRVIDRASPSTPAEAATAGSQVAPEEPPALAPPEITLKGVMIDPEHRSALIQFALGNAEWIEESAVIEGWKLVEIQAGSITIAQSGVTHVFPLYKQN